MPTLSDAVSAFGARAKAKLNNPAAQGEAEDQLRAPFEVLVSDLAQTLGIAERTIAAVGETALRHLKTRPDYAITRQNTLVGHAELKSPGKGADPRKFRDAHDAGQWEKLQTLPNLMYSDGNSFSLWQNGTLVGTVVRLNGNVETSGAALDAPKELLTLFQNFFDWAPIPPRTAKELAETSARLCRLLREEVTEQLTEANSALNELKADWRQLLFPEASDDQFSDSYAQAVTFGLLMARARGIQVEGDLSEVARKLGQTSSLIGAALGILTEDLREESGLKTSIKTLKRVLAVVDWGKITKGNPDAWLYFYEDFLDVYDKRLRKLTGSYYTPPPVVREMVRLVDDVLRTRFDRLLGLAATDVTLADPAVGTGTFPLGVLEKIATTIRAVEGEGAVSSGIRAALERLIAFELQLGPFAVAQLRLMAEVSELIGTTSVPRLRMYVTDTLGNPYEEQEWLPHGPQYRAISDSRKQANKIKRDESITVVLGNPPYKEKAKGRGGWIEEKSNNSPDEAPLAAWMPPAEWGVGAHAKHLRNLYVYFWRWATWKVFDRRPGTGIVCFITAAGFLNGDGFQRMREYLRRKCDEVWVIDCSPEGHQPEVSTRFFQGVQHPVCIVIASRNLKKKPDQPALARYSLLPKGDRETKFEALKKLPLDGRRWQACSENWRASFLPEAKGVWSKLPLLRSLFQYDGSGVMPGRTWVIAPEIDSLEKRWRRLQKENDTKKKMELFHPHVMKAGLGDKYLGKNNSHGLGSHMLRTISVEEDREACVPPVHYGFRSFDRQWIIPDNRLINRPNPRLWQVNSGRQVYLTAPDDRSPTSGPALTFTALVPDLHHYNGRGGRTIPLWDDAAGDTPNVFPDVLLELSRRYKFLVGAEDLMAYLAAIMANPAYTARFQSDLSQPGLRVPLTASGKLFRKAANLGRTVVWLHTFGERFVDADAGRPFGPPRMDKGKRPLIPLAGAIPAESARMPDSIEYDLKTRRLMIGEGYVENVPAAVWNYDVSGKHVVRQWFSYRKKNRERPIIGDRRPPSELGAIQPGHWLAEYTSELINLLNVLGRLVELEPQQAALLDEICDGSLISADEIKALATDSEESLIAKKHRRKKSADQTELEY